MLYCTLPFPGLEALHLVLLIYSLFIQPQEFFLMLSPITTHFITTSDVQIVTLTSLLQMYHYFLPRQGLKGCFLHRAKQSFLSLIIFQNAFSLFHY